MLVLPFVLGAASGGWQLASGLVAVAALLAFLAHYALVPVVQRTREGRPAPPEWLGRRVLWGAIDLTGAALSFGAALVLAPATVRGPMALIALAAVAMAGLYSSVAALGAGRLAVVELTGMAGCSLAAPMMALAAGRPPEPGLVAAPALAFGYSASTLAFVRAWGRLDGDRAGAFSACAAAHGLLLVALAGLWSRGWLPPIVTAAFAPVLVRTIWGMTHPPRTIRQVGLREIWVAASVAILGSLALLVS